MPKGYVDGQAFCSFITQFYVNVVMAQHCACVGGACSPEWRWWMGAVAGCKFGSAGCACLFISCFGVAAAAFLPRFNSLSRINSLLHALLFSFADKSALARTLMREFLSRINSLLHTFLFSFADKSALTLAAHISHAGKSEFIRDI